MSAEENILPNTVTHFFPGMAASNIMFYKYRDLPFECEFHNWIDPLPKETMKEYAARYIETMDLTKKVNLVGVSFGGVLAVEIARQIEVNQVVLVSSMPNKSIFPAIMKFFKIFPIYKIIPGKMPPVRKGMIRRIFGIQRDEDVEFFIKMIKDYDFKNLRWSIGQLVNWKFDGHIPNLVHIIGDQDKLFRPGSSEKEIVIKGGTHYMVVDRAKDVKVALTEVLIERNQDVAA